jgi:transposase-like protein
MVNYIIPSVSSQLKLERRCPHCHRSNGNVHSRIYYRPISDVKVTTIAQQRMKCPWCKTTWTIRAEGIGHGRQRSHRLISMAVFLYMLGLSYRGVETFFTAAGWKGSKSSIERDVARAGQKAKALHLAGPRLRVRTLGVDGTGAKMAGKKKAGLLFFVDIERAKLLCIEPVKETDSRKVRQHVLRVMHEVDAEQCTAWLMPLRTDELSVYEGIVPEENHNLCLAHWRKSKCKRAWQLFRQLRAEGLQFESQDMLKLIELLRQEPRPPTLPESIEKLVRRYINCHRGTLWKVNQLLQHIERTWSRVSSEEGDRTNNTTERIIGLDYKIRLKTMRGLKNDDKVLGHCYLSEYLRGVDGICDLRKVV